MFNSIILNMDNKGGRRKVPKEVLSEGAFYALYLL